MKTKFSGILTLLLAFVVQISFAQDKLISGTVSDETGPLPGVSILKKGTTEGTETDFDGKYSVKAKAGDILVFSFVGMKVIEKKVGASNKIDVQMQSDNQLEEVVVVAYGTQKKQSLSGSIKTIKAETISEIQSADAVQGLKGKITGVQIISTSGQPGESTSNIRFRGVGSLSASNNPLYVVDGVPFNGSPSSISQQDIQSISFLKDASANALYGSRGANGVVLITTKKGKKNKMSITLETKLGVNSRAIPDYDIIKSPKEYYELRYQRLRLAQMENTKLTEEEQKQNASSNLVKDLGYNIFNVPNDQIIDIKTGKVSSDASVLYNDNWNDLLFRKAFRRENFFSLSYGTDKLQSYISLGHLKNNGYVVNSDFERTSSRINLKYNINEKIELGGNLNFTSSIQNDPQAGKASGTFSNLFSWTRNLAPIYPAFARDKYGKLKFDKDGNKIFDFGKNDTTNPDGSLAERKYIENQNPYATTLKDKKSNKTNSINSRAFVSFDFFENFNFRYNLGYDLSSGNKYRYGYEKKGDYSTYNGSITNGYFANSTITHQQLLNWKKKIDDHNLDIMIGHESSKYKSEKIAGNKTNIVIPGESFLSNATKTGYIASYNDNYRIEGFLSKLNYDYNNKYFFNASFRRDGSSVFHPDNRWGNFFGLGLAWNLKAESFLEENEQIKSLKLKASYGEQGNDNIYYPSYVSFDHRNFYSFSRNYHPYLTQYDISQNAKGQATIKRAYLGNKNLKWEVSKNLNIGLEVNFIDRINLEFEYFRRGVSDMLYNFPLPLSGGFPSESRNVGDMVNKGFELSLGIDAIKTDDILLNIWGNSTTYKNEITKLPASYNSGAFRFIEGKSAYTYNLKQFAGIDNKTGEALWYIGDTDADNISTGKKEKTKSYRKATTFLSDKTANPDFYGGFGLNLNYKTWNLSAGFAYQFGGYAYDNVYAGLFSEGTGTGFSGNNYHKDIYKTWTPENKNATMPRISSIKRSQYASSDFFLIKSDYVSLENISLSYTLNKKFLKSSNIKSIKFGLLGSNLFLWSKRQGFDPRMIQLGGSRSNGSNLNNYSLLKTISLNLTFKI